MNFKSESIERNQRVSFCVFQRKETAPPPLHCRGKNNITGETEARSLLRRQPRRAPLLSILS